MSKKKFYVLSGVSFLYVLGMGLCTVHLFQIETLSSVHYALGTIFQYIGIYLNVPLSVVTVCVSVTNFIMS